MKTILIAKREGDGSTPLKKMLKTLFPECDVYTVTNSHPRHSVRSALEEDRDSEEK